MKIIDAAEKLFADKRRWRTYRERVGRLPATYRIAVDGLERYLLHTGPSDGQNLMPMLEDLADLFEQSAADGTTVREVVGAEPVEFAEAFKQNYGVMGWLDQEQQRLTAAIDQAEQTGPDQQTGPERQAGPDGQARP